MASNSIVGPLLTDLYQLRMAYVYWKVERYLGVNKFYALLQAGNARFVIVFSLTEFPRHNSIIEPINRITFIKLINSDGITQCVVII